MPSIVNTPTTISSQLVVKKRVQSCIQKEQYIHVNALNTVERKEDVTDSGFRSMQLCRLGRILSEV